MSGPRFSVKNCDWNKVHSIGGQPRVEGVFFSSNEFDGIEVSQTEWMIYNHKRYEVVAKYNPQTKELTMSEKIGNALSSFHDLDLERQRRIVARCDQNSSSNAKKLGSINYPLVVLEKDLPHWNTNSSNMVNRSFKSNNGYAYLFMDNGTLISHGTFDGKRVITTQDKEILGYYTPFNMIDWDEGAFPPKISTIQTIKYDEHWKPVEIPEFPEHVEETKHTSLSNEVQKPKEDTKKNGKHTDFSEAIMSFSAPNAVVLTFPTDEEAQQFKTKDPCKLCFKIHYWYLSD